MDPFLVQSSQPAAVRPALALESDLASVLREGRVLAGEVLQTLDGGSLLIGVGQHRVPARSQVELQPGQRFLFVVESGEEPYVLRLLTPEGPGEPELVRALRGVWGEDLPMGALLTRLAASARATAASSGDAEPAVAQRLLGEIAQHVVVPQGDAGAVRDAVVRSGLGYESRLVRLYAASAGDQQRAVAALADSVVQTLGATPVAELREALWNELERLAGPSVDRAALSGMLARGELADLMRDPHGVLARAVHALFERQAGAGRQQDPSAALVLVAFRNVPPALRPAVLMQLLGGGAVPRPDAPRAQRASLANDFKGQLLRALSELPEGALRETVARTLSGLEAEQLLNLARSAGDQPLHWTLAVPDGARWADLHLFHRRWQGGGHADGPPDEVHKIVVGVDLGRTGPLRADLLVRAESLSVRLTASRPDVVERLRAALPELEQRLALGGRRVLLSVTRAGEDKVRVDEEVADIAYLRDHRVMDLEG